MEDDTKLSNIQNYDGMISTVKAISNVMSTVVNEDYISIFSKALEAFSKYIGDNFYVPTKVKELSDYFIKCTSYFSFESSESDFVHKIANDLAIHGLTFEESKILGLDSEKLNKEIVNDAINDFVNQKSFNSFLDNLASIPYMNTQKGKDFIDCFKLGKYYACVSILFEVACQMIETFHINSPKRKCVLPKEYYDKFSNTYNLKNKQIEIINTIYLMFYYFRYGQNFENEENGDFPLINRNYIAHGMSKREITRNDCVNLMFFIESLYKTIRMLKIEK